MSNYEWRTVPSYRLSQSALDKFLVDVFGNMNFYIRLKSDDWEFWADRDLTDVGCRMSEGLGRAMDVNRCINRAKKKGWTKNVWIEQPVGAKEAEPRSTARPSMVVERQGVGRRVGDRNSTEEWKFDRVQAQLMKDPTMKDFNLKEEFERMSGM